MKYTTILIWFLIGLFKVTAAAPKQPINNGILRGNLDAGGYYITNVAGITDPSGEPITGGDGFANFTVGRDLMGKLARTAGTGRGPLKVFVIGNSMAELSTGVSSMTLKEWETRFGIAGVGIDNYNFYALNDNPSARLNSMDTNWLSPYFVLTPNQSVKFTNYWNGPGFLSDRVGGFWLSTGITNSFTLLCSTNGGPFGTLAVLQATNNGSVLHHTNFTMPLNYYRLCFTNTSGQTNYVIGPDYLNTQSSNGVAAYFNQRGGATLAGMNSSLLNLTNAIRIIQPDLIWFALKESTSAAWSNGFPLLKTLQGCVDSPLLVQGEYFADETPSNARTVNQFLHDQSLTNNWAFFDSSYYGRSYEYQVAQGWMADTVHMNLYGGLALAQRLMTEFGLSPKSFGPYSDARAALGGEVNVALAGAVPGGFDNQILFSNLLAAGGSLYFPPGDWASSPVVKNINTPPSFIRGAGDGTIWRNLGASNTWALKLAAANCTVRNLQINPNQTVPAYNAGYCTITDSPYTNNIANLGGGLWISAVGFPVVENVYFVSNAATALYFEGWRDIGYRSNHLSLVNIRATRNYNAVVGGATNATEYCILDGLTTSENVNYDLSVQDANFIAMGLNINGWQDGNGVFGTVTGTALHYRSRASRAHSKFGPGQINHKAVGIDAVGDGAMEDLTLLGLNVGGSSSNAIRGFAQMDVAFCHFEGYSVIVTTNAGAATNSISWPIPAGNTIIGGGTVVSNIGSLHWQNNYVRGLIHDGIGRRIFHYGEPNWLVGTGRDTNDYVVAGKGGVIGTLTVRPTGTDTGIGSQPTSWLNIAAGGSLNGAIQTEGLIYANGIFVTNYLGFHNAAHFRRVDDSYSFSLSGHNMELWNWTRNALASLELNMLRATFANGSFNIYSNTAGKVLEYTNTTSAKGFVVDTNADVTAASFTGSGAGLTSLNASQLTSGTVPNAALTNRTLVGQTNQSVTVFQSGVTNGQTVINSNKLELIGAGSTLTIPSAGSLLFGPGGSSATISIVSGAINYNADLRTSSVWPGSDAVRTVGTTANRYTGFYGFASYYPSNTLTLAQASAGITNGGHAFVTMSNSFWLLKMTNNVLYTTNLGIAFFP